MNDTENLKGKVADAISVLTVKFKVTPEEQAKLKEPTIEIYEGRSRYRYDTNRLQLNATPEDLWPLVIGEEIAHYIHFGINPHIFTVKPEEATTVFDFLHRVFSVEMIGRYGGLVYASVKGLCEFPFKKSHRYTENPDDTLDHLGHELGYQRAYKVFELHGDEHLPKLARMNAREVIDFSRKVAPISLYERKIMPLFNRT